VGALADHFNSVYSVLGLGGVVAFFALRTFLKLARIVVIAVLAVAVVAAVHGGLLP
jgi:hypothetical protein